MLNEVKWNDRYNTNVDIIDRRVLIARGTCMDDYLIASLRKMGVPGVRR